MNRQITQALEALADWLDKEAFDCERNARETAMDHPQAVQSLLGARANSLRNRAATVREAIAALSSLSSASSAPVMDEKGQREKFEAWARKRLSLSDDNLKREEDDSYTYVKAWTGWEVWRAISPTNLMGAKWNTGGLDLFAEASAWSKRTGNSITREIAELLGRLTGAVQCHIERITAPAPSAAEPVAPEYDVRKILVAVVPGDDGIGREVYAKSVDEVVDLLTRMSEELEDFKRATLPNGLTEAETGATASVAGLSGDAEREALTETLLQGMCDAIEQDLLSYRCTNIVDADDGQHGFPLTDLLTLPGDKDIKRGQDEIHMIVDSIYHAIKPLLSAALHSTGKPAAKVVQPDPKRCTAVVDCVNGRVSTKSCTTGRPLIDRGESSDGERDYYECPDCGKQITADYREN